MNVALWALQVVLALAMLGAGGFKLATPKEKLPARMGWHEDFTQPQIKAIGAVEVLGALGLVLPGLFGVATILTPIAATGLALVLIGAVVVHVRRKENSDVAAPALLAVAAIVIAVLRFGPYPL